jgi:hypothetical protein
MVHVALALDLRALSSFVPAGFEQIGHERGLGQEARDAWG